MDTDDDGDGVADTYDYYPTDASQQYLPLADAVAGIADDTLRQCVASLSSEMSSIAEFLTLGSGFTDGCAGSVSSLSGLEVFVHLEQLVLIDGSISDVTPLSGLIDLERIELESQQVTDVSPITDLPRLLHLGLNYNPLLSLPSGTYLTNLSNYILHPLRCETTQQLARY